MDDDGGGMGRREASVLLACQFLPVYSSAPSLPRPPAACNPNFALSSAAVLFFAETLFSFAEWTGRPQTKEGQGAQVKIW